MNTPAPRLAGLLLPASIWLRSRKAAILLSVFVMTIFLMIALVRVYPYVDNVNPQNSKGDDWLSYKLNAISILEGGLHMPSVKGAYWLPGGFLYTYFVAAIFAIAGPNTAYVYVVQSVCVALCAVLLFVLARRYMSPILACAYLFVTSVFLLDAFRDWAGMLLSENLAIVLYPLAILLLVRAIQVRSLWCFSAAGFIAGLVVLTRPNLIGWPLLLAPLVLWSADRMRRRLAALLLFSGSSVAAILILPFRNFYVTNQWAGSRYGSLIPAHLDAGEIALMVGKRLLLCAGVMIGQSNLGRPEVVINKRWLVLTVVAIASVAYLAIKRRVQLPDVICLLTIAAAYGPFALLPALGGYGFRFQFPYGPLLIFFIFHAAHEWLVAKARKKDVNGEPV